MEADGLLTSFFVWALFYPTTLSRKRQDRGDLVADLDALDALKVHDSNGTLWAWQLRFQVLLRSSC